MSAVVVPRYGDADVLEDANVTIEAEPKPGFIRVRVAAVALNHLDLWVRRGLPHLKLSLPHRLGSDIVGTIESVGDGVEGYTIGERTLVAPGLSCGHCETCLRGHDHLCRHYKILGENTHGGYAEFVDVPASNVLPYPQQLPFHEAAAIPLVFLTAWQMIVEKAKVERNETVLIHAAGSGVSTAAIQLAKLRGARVIATSTNAAKLEQARCLGADEVIDVSYNDFVSTSRMLTQKRGVDVVIEHIGGETFSKSLLALANAGRLVICGATSGATPSIDLRYVFFRQLAIMGSTMGSKSSLFSILRLADQKLIKPVVDRVLPLNQEGAREAHRLLEERKVFGKIVLSKEIEPNRSTI